MQTSNPIDIGNFPIVEYKANSGVLRSSVLYLFASLENRWLYYGAFGTSPFCLRLGVVKMVTYITQQPIATDVAETCYGIA